ncbi:MAG: rRNA maturation RNase YbeY [Planctomycetes bacterium]|nr:rRNA maturation RNase YbeY [Planctomycetota bacterium]
MHKINIYDSQPAVPVRINPARLKNILKYILKKECQPPGIFNFIFVDNRQIRRLNRAYLGMRNVTDVIAFPLADNRDSVRGEVVVSVEEAARQSRKLGIPLNREIALYCIHGLLHLIGYDDLSKSRRIKMERKQAEYLKMANP